MSSANIKEEEEAETDLISQRAEIFRSQLISDFHLLESISEGGSRIEAPNLFTADITDTERMKKMMLNRPHGLVRFHIYDKMNTAFTSAERRRNRLVNKRRRNPPIDLWANHVVTSAWFQNSILVLILSNSIILGVQAEINDIHPKSVQIQQFALVLDIFDYIALMCFMAEIILKWLDNFRDFWRNNWNIFDFVVTFASFIPEILKYSSLDVSSGGIGSGLVVVADNLRTFRVLRSLKMVTRFQKVRLIVLAVTKAFKEMVFITLLLFIFAYIFAIIGIMFLNYEDYADQLTYKHSFSSFLGTMVTLFQLFTLDHWLDVYKDVRIVAGQVFAALYVIVWIVIGSFIIRNIVVGIMVNNFQSIRNELFQEVGEIREREKRDQEMAMFAEELDRQTHKRGDDCDGDEPSEQINTSQHIQEPKLDARATVEEEDEDEEEESATRLHPCVSRFASGADLRDAMDQDINRLEQESEQWQAIVERNLENLSKEEASFCWPRDSLFKYYLMLEALQENIKERQEILAMANESLTWIQDK